MANRQKHLEIGFIISGILFIGYLFFQYRKKGKLEKNDYITSAIGSLLCLFTSILPDILEPAYSPNHRAFFHSKTFSILISGLTTSGSVENNDHEIVFLMIASLSGFLCHIFLDSTTQKGLPFI